METLKQILRPERAYFKFLEKRKAETQTLIVLNFTVSFVSSVSLSCSQALGPFFHLPLYLRMSNCTISERSQMSNTCFLRAE